MKLIWKWCHFEKERSIIWIYYKNKHIQFIFGHEFYFRKNGYDKKNMPRIINI